MKLFVVRVEYHAGTSITVGLWDNFEDAYGFARKKAEETQHEIVEFKHEICDVATEVPSIIEYDTSVELEGVSTLYVTEIKKVN